MAVGDVPAERLLADLPGAEDHGRGADEATGAVDDAHGYERRSFALEILRKAQRAEEGEAGEHDGGGAAVLAGDRRADQRDAETRSREAEGRGKADGARAGHDDVGDSVQDRRPGFCLGIG